MTIRQMLRLGGLIALAALSLHAPLGAQQRDEQFYLPGTFNWKFLSTYPEGARLFNAFDYGHAVLYERMCETTAASVKLGPGIAKRGRAGAMNHRGQLRKNGRGALEKRQRRQRRKVGPVSVQPLFENMSLHACSQSCKRSDMRRSAAPKSTEVISAFQ